MIFHVSIPADDPQRVARVIAELWRTEYFPFVWPESYVVIADDERGTAVEVLKRGYEQVPAQAEVGLRGNHAPSPYSECHVLMAIRRTEEEILAIARREGWIARVCDRKFHRLIEFWLENRFLLELETETQLQRYRAFMSTGNWRAVLAVESMPLAQFGFAQAWLSDPNEGARKPIVTATPED